MFLVCPCMCMCRSTCTIHKKVTPPFKPEVKSGRDMSRVDDTFLNEAAIITPTPSGAVLVSKDAFKDFTFAESSGIALSADVVDED